MQAINKNIHQHVPNDIDRTKRYLFYLHGLIVEEAGIRPKSEEHGYYEYELILEQLAKEDFIVISEARPKGTEIIAYAENITSQVKLLLANKVSPKNIIHSWCLQRWYHWRLRFFNAPGKRDQLCFSSRTVRKMFGRSKPKIVWQCSLNP